MVPMKFLLFLAAAFASAQSLTLSLVPSSAVPGQTVVLNINYTDASPSANLAAFQGQLLLPNTITPPATGPTAGHPDQSFVADYNPGNLVFIVGGWGPLSVAPPILTIPSGPVLQWQLTIPPNAPLGTSTVSLAPASSPNLGALLGANAAGDAVALTANTVTLIVTSIYDLNGDGKIDAADVQLARAIAQGQVANGCVAPFSLVGDHKCDVRDVILVWLAALGIIH